MGVQFLYGEDALDVAKQKHLKQFKFLAQNLASVVRRLADDTTSERLDAKLEQIATKLNYGVASEVLKKSMKKYHKRGDLGASEVTMSQYSPSRYVGSVSESFAEAREKVGCLFDTVSLGAVLIMSSTCEITRTT